MTSLKTIFFIVCNPVLVKNMLFLAFVINALKLKQMLATQRKYAVQSFEIVLFLVKFRLQKFHVFRNFAPIWQQKGT